MSGINPTRKRKTGNSDSPVVYEEYEGNSEEDEDNKDNAMTVSRDKSQTHHTFEQCDFREAHQELNKRLKEYAFEMEDRVIQREKKIIDWRETANAWREKAKEREIALIGRDQSFIAKEKNIIELERMFNKLGEENLEYRRRLDVQKFELSNAQKQIAYLSGQRRGILERTRRTYEPSYIPDSILSTTLEYKHPNAPRDNRMYKGFEPKPNTPNCEGKVKPSKYGSNSNWDLGLCNAHFCSPRNCRNGSGCEWRHLGLSEKEKLYISRLGDVGRAFLNSC